MKRSRDDLCPKEDALRTEPSQRHQGLAEMLTRKLACGSYYLRLRRISETTRRADTNKRRTPSNTSTKSLRATSYPETTPANSRRRTLNFGPFELSPTQKLFGCHWPFVGAARNSRRAFCWWQRLLTRHASHISRLPLCIAKFLAAGRASLSKACWTEAVSGARERVREEISVGRAALG